MTKQIDITTLLPQQPPFVMIDRLEHCDPVVTETRLEIKPDTFFCTDGVFGEAGLVENIAQTCAARIGYMNLQAGEDVKVGFIGALKNLVIHSLPQTGDLLETRIEVLSEVLSMTLVKATVVCGGKLLAECEMKIAVSGE